jgi:hypothetical protein
MNALLAQVKAQAAAGKIKDQTAEQDSFTYEPPAAGRSFMRFVGYVEVGKRKQKPFQGKDKPDALMARLLFELVGKKHGKEIDGKTVYPILSVNIAVKGGDKAGFVKLLHKMDYGRGATHMALMLGEGFIGTVVHNVVKVEGQPDKVYANIKDKDGNWLIGAPMLPKDPSDPMCDEMVPVAVPEATAPIQCLLWDGPTKEQWDSIFIDGTREKKDDKGNVTVVSKNWLQEDIVKNATDFQGSPLQALMLEMAGDDLELDGGKAAAQAPQGDPLDAAPTPAPKAETPPAKPVDAAPIDPQADALGLEPDAGDALAALGFDDL